MRVTAASRLLTPDRVSTMAHLSRFTERTFTPRRDRTVYTFI